MAVFPKSLPYVKTDVSVYHNPQGPPRAIQHGSQFYNIDVQVQQSICTYQGQDRYTYHIDNLSVVLQKYSSQDVPSTL